MDSFQLRNEKNQPIDVWVCGKCRLFQPSYCTRQAAEQCCRPSRCRTCDAPIDYLKHGAVKWLDCATCREEHSIERHQAKVDKAVKVPLHEYDREYVCMGDRIVLIDELCDAIESGERDPDDVVWGTAPRKLRFDAGELVWHALEAGAHYDDAYDDIGDAAVARLQRQLDAWCDEVEIVSHFEDQSVVVVITPPEETDAC